MKWSAGWVFRHGDTYYWVGASDAEAAKQLVAKHSPEEQKSNLSVFLTERVLLAYRRERYWSARWATDAFTAP